MIRLIALLALLSGRAGAVLPHDPWPAWSTFSSEHFDVHAHEGVTELAPRVAAICESEYLRLRQLFKFEVESRIDIVLADETDEANGAATSFPRPEIFLIVAPFDAWMGADEFDDWLHYLVSHELTHVFHLDHSRGFPHFLRKVFGHFPLFMNAYFQPPWVLEGLATYSESDNSSHVGRGQSSYFRALMRLEVAKGIKSIRQVNQPIASWPAGTTRYLYGVYFMKFLEARYGKDSIRRWVENYSDDWIPYFFNRNARHTFGKGKSMGRLWQEFKVWLLDEFGPELERLRPIDIQGAAAPGPATGAYFWGPMKGDYALRNDGRSQARLQKLEAGKWRDITRMNSQRFSVGKDRLLLIEDGLIEQSKICTDLYEAKLDGSDKRRLTYGLRVREAVDMNAGTVAVAGGAGQKKLLMLERDGAIRETLWQGSDGENPSTLSASPDGRRLAASLWRKSRGWDLVEFDFEKREWRELMARPEQEITPSWSADGSEIYFSADYGRVFNIYSLNLGSGALAQLSNVVGAAMHPNPRGDKLDFSLLTADGFERGELPLGQARALTLPAATSLNAMPVSPVAMVAVTETAYAPIKTLWPSWWLPALEGNSRWFYAGFETFANDVLDRHQIELVAMAGGPSIQLFGSARYAYMRYLPQFEAGASRYPGAEYAASGDKLHLRNSEAWSLGIDLPYGSAWRGFDFSGVASRRRVTEAVTPAPEAPIADSDELLYNASAAYSSLRSYAKSIGSSDGLAANISYSRLNPGLDADGAWVSWGLSRPTSLFGLNILEFNLGGGSIQQGSYVFTLAESAPAWIKAPHFRPDFELKGYEGGIPELRGQNTAGAHLGWRFPIVSIERGWMAPPLGIDKIFGRAMVDSGRAGDSWDGEWKAKSSVGLELDFVVVIGYNAISTFSIGWHKGVDSGGIDQLYINLGGTPF